MDISFEGLLAKDVLIRHPPIFTSYHSVRRHILLTVLSNEFD